MSNWKFLNKHRRGVGAYATTEADGFNGMFMFWLGASSVLCVASDGGGWKHVSVSLPLHPSTTPKWDLMCAVKDLFWDEEDVVIQIHPKKSQYVNHHAGAFISGNALTAGNSQRHRLFL